MTNTLYIPDKQAAQRHDVSRETVWRWKRDGGFPEAVKLSRGMTCWRAADLEEWERSREMHFAFAMPFGLDVPFGRES